jgi:hypothetical protein
MRNPRNEYIDTYVPVCLYASRPDSQALADLFLDTTAFNGHGTLAQALWAAIPVFPISVSVPVAVCPPCSLSKQVQCQ